jgi:hypothetical protein
VDATSNTVTPSSEPADPLQPDERKGMDSLRDLGARLKREKSPLKYSRRISEHTGTEPLTEISLEEPHNDGPQYLFCRG